MTMDYVFQLLQKEYDLFMEACEGKSEFDAFIILTEVKNDMPKVVPDDFAAHVLNNYHEILGGKLLMDRDTVKKMIVSMFFAHIGV